MSREGLAIGRVFGIEIRVSVTWAVLIAIVTVVGAEQATMSAPDLGAIAQWSIGAAVAAGFLLSVVAHELAHALTARGRGVPVTWIVLGFVGGLAPLNIQASRPRDELTIALVGPILSLVLAAIFIPLGAALGSADPGLVAIAGAVIVVGGLNLLLGLLSLLPGMPLDGGRAIRAVAWARSGNIDQATRVTARVGRIVGWTTMGVGVAIALSDHTTEALLVLCLGWFLSTGARTLDRRQALEQLLRGVPVRDAMERDVAWVGPHVTVDTFAPRFEGEGAVLALPVVDDERVLGVLGARRLKRLGRGKFATTRAGDVMSTPPDAPLLAPSDDVWAAIDVMNATGLDALAVAEDGHLAGLLTRHGLSRLVQTRLASRGGALA